MSGASLAMRRSGVEIDIPLLIVSLIAFLALIFWLDDIGKR